MDRKQKLYELVVTPDEELDKKLIGKTLDEMQEIISNNSEFVVNSDGEKVLTLLIDVEADGTVISLKDADGDTKRELADKQTKAKKAIL